MKEVEIKQQFVCLDNRSYCSKCVLKKGRYICSIGHNVKEHLTIDGLIIYCNKCKDYFTRFNYSKQQCSIIFVLST